MLVWLERSLKSSLKEALRKHLLCDDYSDLTSPTSNRIPDTHVAVSVVYDTFSCMRFTYCLNLYINCEMKLRVLLLKYYGTG